MAGKPGKPIYLAESVAAEEHPLDETSLAEQNTYEQAVEFPMVDDSLTNAQYADQTNASSEEIWLSQWWNQEGTYLVQETNDGRGAESCREAIKHTEEKQPSLVESNESFRGIIDSGASRSVVGAAWVGRLSNLTKQDSWESKAVMSKRSFRFGDGETSPSMGTIGLNVTVQDIHGVKVPLALEVDVVENDIPLLISRRSLGKWKRRWISSAINCVSCRKPQCRLWFHREDTCGSHLEGVNPV